VSEVPLDGGSCGKGDASSVAILCTGGLDVIRKEAWPLYRTISGVSLCWELEEPKGPKGSPTENALAACCVDAGIRVLQGYLAHCSRQVDFR